MKLHALPAPFHPVAMPLPESAERWIRVLILLGIFLLGSVLPTQAAPPRLRLGTIVPRGSSYYNHLQRMGQAWQEAPDGGARLVIYPDSRMGGEAEMVRRMRNGQLQAGLLTVVGLGEIEPNVAGLQSMPMKFRNLKEVDYVGERLQPELEKRIEEKGFVVLFWADAGWVQFFTAEPVIYPDDLKKLKIWTWAGNPHAVDIYEKAGFTPVPLETKDILLNLQTKAITAVPMPPTVAMVSQVDTYAPHMLNLNWAPLVGACIVVKEAWNELSPADRQFMKKEALKSGTLIQNDGRQEAEDSIAAMKKRGLTLHSVNPEIEASWRKVAESAYPEIRGRVVPAEIVDRVDQLLEEFRARP